MFPFLSFPFYASTSCCSSGASSTRRFLPLPLPPLASIELLPSFISDLSLGSLCFRGAKPGAVGKRAGVGLGTGTGGKVGSGVGAGVGGLVGDGVGGLVTGITGTGAGIGTGTGCVGGLP